ncbi:biotin--[acetyl-CoA-carboxylase] ligase [Afifella sp. IM 167]|uniref:biotin--[acetyl-CoA-carboxylase] ligase n=1 Tax=Afifella sp. IM 167 TaxID=2033586 RepID=UPI001CCE6717|nr:biotin--[acetyl-CoA-carboxylase] ligase [Afifella sp. IM 167]MBZ8132411.1 biotin--[acetyl-CoA-carboxylase] ligase [Afifella sp. IM 167]
MPTFFALASTSSDLAACCGVERRSGGIGPVYYLAEVDSTNRLIADLAAKGEKPGLAVVAHHQTAGRGKGERAWFSEPGKGFALSLLLRPSRPLEEVSQLTLVLGVAVAAAIRRATGVPAELKWPNDVLVGGRKLCGILCELVTTPEGDTAHVIAGMGINVNLAEADFPPALAATATSLAIEVGHQIDFHRVLSAILEEVETWIGRWEEEGFEPVRQAWIARSCTIGRELDFDAGDARLTGIASDLGSDGSLSIRDRSGAIHHFYYGEASLKPASSAFTR